VVRRRPCPARHQSDAPSGRGLPPSRRERVRQEHRHQDHVGCACPDVRRDRAGWRDLCIADADPVARRRHRDRLPGSVAAAQSDGRRERRDERAAGERQRPSCTSLRSQAVEGNRGAGAGRRRPAERPDLPQHNRFRPAARLPPACRDRPGHSDPRQIRHHGRADHVTDTPGSGQSHPGRRAPAF
jgi:hypothetical protein